MRVGVLILALAALTALVACGAKAEPPAPTGKIYGDAPPGFVPPKPKPPPTTGFPPTALPKTHFNDLMQDAVSRARRLWAPDAQPVLFQMDVESDTSGKKLYYKMKFQLISVSKRETNFITELQPDYDNSMLPGTRLSDDELGRYQAQVIPPHVNVDFAFALELMKVPPAQVTLAELRWAKHNGYPAVLAYDVNAEDHIERGVNAMTAEFLPWTRLRNVPPPPPTRYVKVNGKSQPDFLCEDYGMWCP